MRAINLLFLVLGLTTLESHSRSDNEFYLQVGVEQSEELRTVIDQHFGTNSRKEIVKISEISCHARAKKDGFSDHVCTMIRNKFDASIFSGKDANYLVGILSSVGVPVDINSGRLQIKLSKINCYYSGRYSDGSFEHSCTIGNRVNIPLASR